MRLMEMARVCWALALIGCTTGTPATTAPPDEATPTVDLAAPEEPPPDLALARVPGIPKGALLINEVHATNLTGFLDEDQDREDWIEIYNATAQPLDLTGVGLGTSAAALFAFTFPQGAALPAHAYLVVFASKKDRAVWGRPLHAPFNIDQGADKVYLTSPDGTSLDVVKPPRTQPDVSWCRVPDVTGPFLHCTRPTPRAENAGPAYPAMLLPPEVSTPGGCYPDAQTVTLSTAEAGAAIHYTLDGSAPSAASPAYGAPLSIASREGAPNVYSLINTSRLFFYTPKDTEVKKATVLRAAAFADGKLTSPIATHTYFIDPDCAGLYKGAYLASVVVDPPELFSQDNPRGIEVIGPSPGASPWYPGANWWLGREVPGSIEVLAPDRTPAFRTDFGAQVSGAYSRGYAQKSLDVIFRDPYGTRAINYPLFPHRAYTRYKRFRVRASGNEYGRSQIRDLFMQQLFTDSPLDYADYAPVISFLDGEYWGFTEFREKTTGDFLSQLHGVDDLTVDIIDILVNQLGQSDFVEVRNGTRVAFDALRAYVAAHPALIQADFALIQSLVDVENLTNYFAANLFVNNNDWPHNNVRLWRAQTADSRWRFTLHDDDFAFGLSSNPDTNPFGAIGNSSKMGTLIGQLMKNPQLRTLFINTLADQLNGPTEVNNLNARLDAILAVVQPLMPEHYARFHPNNLTLATWNSEIAKIRSFIQAREAYHVKNAQTFFGLSTAPRYTITVNVNDVAMGSVKINTLDLSRRLLDVARPWQGKYFPGVPITVTAQPRTGFRFVEWQGASASSLARVTLDLSADAELTAVFAPDPTPPPPVPVAPSPPAGLVNVALGALATQSSTAGAAVAGLAVDGDPSGDPARGSIATTNSEPSPFWQVDLGQVHDVWSVRLVNRGDCCGERLSGFHVFVSETDLTGRPYAGLVADASVWKIYRVTPFGDSLTLPVGARGRYVRVQLSEVNALSLAEVQVLAVPPDEGKGPDPARLRNLALGRPATQSSSAAGPDTEAGRAVDGDPDGDLAHGSVAQTLTEATPYWQVDLGGRHPLSSVLLLNRTDCCGGQLAGLVLFVADADMTGRSYDELLADPAVWRREIAGPVGASVRVPTQVAGRYVRVQLKGAAAALQLAEVAVMGLTTPAP